MPESLSRVEQPTPEERALAILGSPPGTWFASDTQQMARDVLSLAASLREAEQEAAKLRRRLAREQARKRSYKEALLERDIELLEWRVTYNESRESVVGACLDLLKLAPGHWNAVGTLEALAADDYAPARAALGSVGVGHK